MSLAGLIGMVLVTTGSAVLLHLMDPYTYGTDGELANVIVHSALKLSTFILYALTGSPT